MENRLKALVESTTAVELDIISLQRERPRVWREEVAALRGEKQQLQEEKMFHLRERESLLCKAGDDLARFRQIKSMPRAHMLSRCIAYNLMVAFHKAGELQGYVDCGVRQV